VTINSPERFVASLWDWGFLDECFKGTRIRLSDIDGIVERNGQFLVIETKGAGVSIPTGQDILLSRLPRSCFTILYLWGDANRPEYMRVWWAGEASPGPYCMAFEMDVRDVVARWFEWANALRMAS
jgi:hypothetical protein